MTNCYSIAGIRNEFEDRKTVSGYLEKTVNSERRRRIGREIRKRKNILCIFISCIELYYTLYRIEITSEMDSIHSN